MFLGIPSTEELEAVKIIFYIDQSEKVLRIKAENQLNENVDRKTEQKMNLKTMFFFEKFIDAF